MKGMTMTSDHANNLEVTNHCGEHSDGTTTIRYTAINTCLHCYCKQERCCASPACLTVQQKCCKCGAVWSATWAPQWSQPTIPWWQVVGDPPGGYQIGDVPDGCTLGGVSWGSLGATP